MKSSGTYLNNRVLSVAPGYGMTFTLGLEQDGLSDALYLNPHFEYAYAGNPYEAYGYLMKTERVPLAGPSGMCGNIRFSGLVRRLRRPDRLCDNREDI